MNSFERTMIEAARSGDATALKAALQAPGINVNARDNKHATALILAAVAKSTECIALLLDAKADPSLQEGKTKDTALHKIIGWDGPTEAIELLINASSNLEVKNSYGRTPILCAVSNGCTEAFWLLHQRKSNLHTTDVEGAGAALHLFSSPNYSGSYKKNQRSLIFNELLANKVPFDVPNRSGLSASTYIHRQNDFIEFSKILRVDEERLLISVSMSKPQDNPEHAPKKVRI